MKALGVYPGLACGGQPQPDWPMLSIDQVVPERTVHKAVFVDGAVKT